jgi:predicted hydrocarbon binding protein
VNRVFGAELQTKTSTPEVRMTSPLSVEALPDGTACTFYGSAYAELLRWLAGFEGTMDHQQCRARGQEACLWRGVAAEAYE